MSASVAILSWQLGPVYALLDLILLSLLIGTRSLAAFLRVNRRPMAIVASCLGSALALWIAYGAASGVMHSIIQVSVSSIALGWGQMGAVLRDAVYGPAEQHLPALANWAWWLFTAALVLWTAGCAKPRERLLLIATSLVALAFPIAFYAWAYRFSGFPLAARYVLPVFMIAPLLAGELLSRRAHPVPARLGRGVLIAVGGIIGAIQLMAWWRDARASSGSDHWFRFFDFAHWTPPAGWGFWIAVALVAAGALAGVLAFGPSTGSRPRTARRG